MGTPVPSSKLKLLPMQLHVTVIGLIWVCVLFYILKLTLKKNISLQIFKYSFKDQQSQNNHLVITPLV